MSTSSPSSFAAAAAAVGHCSGGSTSHITAETTTGWHELKVESYTRSKGGVGKGIRSVTFGVGGHSWYIKYYPDGNVDNSADWMSVYLYLDEAAAADSDVKARYTFSMFHDGAAAAAGGGEPVESPIAYARTSKYWFWKAGQHRGYYQFIKGADLEEELKLTGGGGFRIRCEITVVKETCVEAAVADSVTVPPPDLNHHLGELLDSGVGGDVAFDVGGEVFTAHRYVLAARSSVLMAELFGPMKENAMARIRVHGVEPRVFRAMLHFIYTDELPEIEEEEEEEAGMAQHLLVAADMYDMKRLKVMCEAMLLKHIDTSVLATTLTLAEQHRCHGLKEGCFKFLKSPGNTKAVVESDGFQHLRRRCPSLIEEILVKVAP